MGSEQRRRRRLDALLDAGANIEAAGAVIGGGTPLAAAQYLHARGADPDWIGYDKLTALDAAKRSGALDIVDWLSGLGGKSAG